MNTQDAAYLAQAVMCFNEWQKKTFKSATAISKLKHLQKEVSELITELEREPIDVEKLKLEFADCFALLFGSAFEADFGFSDIGDGLYEKLLINMNRTWGEPDADGVVLHIKKEGEE